MGQSNHQVIGESPHANKAFVGYVGRDALGNNTQNCAKNYMAVHIDSDPCFSLTWTGNRRKVGEILGRAVPSERSSVLSNANVSRLRFCGRMALRVS